MLSGVENDYFRILLTGIGPTLGVLVVFFVFKIRPTLNLQGNYRTVVSPLLLYWVTPILLIGGIYFFTEGRFPWVFTLTVLLYGLLEEVGWRGFLHQELKTLPTFLNILIVAVLWFVWHLNFDLTLSNLLFFGILILGSWGIGKVADLTGSLFAVSALHSLNNFYPELYGHRIIVIIFLLLFWIGGLIIRKRLQSGAN